MRMTKNIAEKITVDIQGKATFLHDGKKGLEGVNAIYDSVVDSLVVQYSTYTEPKKTYQIKTTCPSLCQRSVHTARAKLCSAHKVKIFPRKREWNWYSFALSNGEPSGRGCSTAT